MALMYYWIDHLYIFSEGCNFPEGCNFLRGCKIPPGGCAPPPAPLDLALHCLLRTNIYVSGPKFLGAYYENFSWQVLSFHIPSVKDKAQSTVNQFPQHALAPKPVVLRSIMEHDTYNTIRPLLPYLGWWHPSVFRGPRYRQQLLLAIMLSYYLQLYFVSFNNLGLSFSSINR